MPGDVLSRDVPSRTDADFSSTMMRRLGTGTQGLSFSVDTHLDDSAASLAQTRMVVARAKAGDKAAIEYLYLRYANNVYGYVRSIVRNDHDAEDVTQHVFAKLLTSLSKYDDRGVPFFAWLLRLARNVAIDHLRASRTVPSEMVYERDSAAPGDIEQSLTVRDAFASLPEDQREVVVLRHVVGLSPGEIAEQLGRSEASVHGLHHRGRRTLKQALVSTGSAPATLARTRGD